VIMWTLLLRIVCWLYAGGILAVAAFSLHEWWRLRKNAPRPSMPVISLCMGIFGVIGAVAMLWASFIVE
jgi:hypothetical protein